MLKEEHRRRVYDSRMMKKIQGQKKKKLVIWDWKELLNGELGMIK